MYDEKEFKKMLEMDFLGYKIKDLVTATFLLKKAGIEAEEIKDCEKAFSAGAEYMKRLYIDALMSAKDELLKEAGLSYHKAEDVM